MKYQFFIPIFMLISYVIYFILIFNKNKEKQKVKNKNLIRTPRVILWMGIIGTAVPWIFCAVAVYQQFLYVGLIFFIFGFLGLFIISVYINCRVYLEDDKFIIKKAVGKPLVYYYEDIDKVLFKKRVITLVINKKTINLDKLSINIDKLIAKISKEKYDYTNNHTVQINLSFLMTAFLLLIFTSFSYVVGYEISGSIFLLGIALLFLLAVIYCINFSIKYNDDFFNYRNILRISKRIYYSDIEKIVYNKNFIIIKLKKKSLILERSSEGIEAFEKKIQTKYKRGHRS